MNKDRAIAIFWIVMGIGLLGALTWAIIEGLNQEPEYETLTVTSKTKEQSGMSCYGSQYYKNCSADYHYFINGERVGSYEYNQVEEGKTYTCKKTLGGRECQPAQ